MAVNWDRDDIRAFAPDFSATADATVDLCIAQAGRRVSETNWGDLYFDAGVLMTCHLLTIQGHGSGGTAVGSGPVSTISVGEVSTAYANPSIGAGNLSIQGGLGQTKYGIMYAELMTAAGFHGLSL